jgi:hypothetical protein
MRTAPYALALAFALALSPALAFAKEGRPGGGGDDLKDRLMEHRSEFAHRGSNWLLHNDQIAVWFHQGPHGKAKPDLRVAWNGTDDEKAGYRVQILRLCETNESLQCNGHMPRVNLAKADDWNVVTEQTNDSLTLTMVRAEAQAIVTLTWHLNTSSHVVKYDVQVENWKWANASDVLVLDQVVLGHNLENATGASVNVKDSGYIAWASSAQATHGPNDTRSIPVDAKVKHLHEETDEDDDEKSETSGAHLLLVFNGTGGYQKLDYDPELGIASASATSVGVPAPGLLAGLAVVAGAAALLGRRRRS